jgi:Phage gp6-like head-tail connector protein
MSTSDLEQRLAQIEQRLSELPTSQIGGGTFGGLTIVVSGSSYATLDEFKAAVEIADTVDDVDIQRALDSATDFINHYTGRTFWAVDSASTPRYFLPYDTDRLDVPDLSSVTALEIDTVGDESFHQSLAPEDYDLYPLYLATGGYTEIRLKQTAPSWFIPGYQVRVTAFWGYGTTPAAISQACILIANRYFARLSVPFSMWEAPQTGELATLTARDEDVINLLAPYVTSGGAGRAAGASWVLV